MIELRAFRGTRRRSVYRSHALDDEILNRIRDVAGSVGLPLLRALDPQTTPSLDMRDARRLAEEATALRRSGEILELDEELTAIVALARWCQHDRGGWMTVA